MRPARSVRLVRRLQRHASDRPFGAGEPPDHRVFEFILSTSGVEPRAGLPRFDLRKVWGVQKVTGGPLDAVIPGESATPAEPELRIACEGGEKRRGRINATIRTAARTASSFLSHPI